MRVVSVFAALTAAASASPLTMTKIEAFDDYKWEVTNFNAGCGRSGCSYDFNVTGAAANSNPPAPAFSAYCNGFGEGAPYDECELLDRSDTSRRVVAKLLPVNQTGTGAHIQVSYEYEVPAEDIYYNYTGHAVALYNAFVAPPQNFEIIPNTIWGIA